MPEITDADRKVRYGHVARELGSGDCRIGHAHEYCRVQRKCRTVKKAVRDDHGVELLHRDRGEPEDRDSRGKVQGGQCRECIERGHDALHAETITKHSAAYAAERTGDRIQDRDLRDRGLIKADVDLQ